MARIPHVGGTSASFGQRGPDRPSAFSPDTRGMTQGQEALAGTARAGMDMIADVATLQQREAAQQRQADEDLARARGTNALLDYGVAIKARTADLQSRVETGDLDWRKLAEAADTEFREVEIPQILGLNEPDAERLRGGLLRERDSAMQGVQNLAKNAQRTEFKGQVTKTRDTLGKLASEPAADVGEIVAREKALRPLASAAGLGETFDKDSQTFSDTAYSNNANARLNQVRHDMAGLRQLERDLTEEGGYFHGKLDADRTNAILFRVLTAKNTIEARSRSELDRREASAERAIEAFDRQISSGITAPDDFYQRIADTVAGTSHEISYRERQAQEIAVQRVLAMPIADQRAFVQNLEAQQIREGATVQQQANAARLRTRVDSNLKSLRETPLVFQATSTGAPVEPLNVQALMSGDTAAVQRQVADRMVTLRALKAQYGDEAGDAPLLPQEATALAGALSKSSPEGVARTFGALSTAMNDPEAYRAAMQQIAPDEPVLAIAGMLNQRNPKAALLVAQGQSLLNPKEGGKATIPTMPPQDQFDRVLRPLLGDAYRGRPDAYSLDAQAIRAAYAGAVAIDGDLSGRLNVDRLKDVVTAVVGTTDNFNGRGSVFLPYGMRASDFRDRIESAWGAVQPSLPEQWPATMRTQALEQVGPGQYRVRAGRRYVLDANGNPVVLDLTRPAALGGSTR